MTPFGIRSLFCVSDTGRGLSNRMRAEQYGACPVFLRPGVKEVFRQLASDHASHSNNNVSILILLLKKEFDKTGTVRIELVLGQLNYAQVLRAQKGIPLKSGAVPPL